MAITSTRDKLRLELGDTDTNNELFQDDELDYFLSLEADNILAACLRACHAAARKFARAYDFETDGQNFKRSQMQKAYADLAAALEQQGITVTGTAGVQTVDVTKVDGWSDDVANQEVSGSGSSNPRHKYYRVGVADLP